MRWEFKFFGLEMQSGPLGMSQQAKVFAAKLYHLSWVSDTHNKEGENLLLQKVFF